MRARVTRRRFAAVMSSIVLVPTRPAAVQWLHASLAHSNSVPSTQTRNIFVAALSTSSHLIFSVLLITTILLLALSQVKIQPVPFSSSVLSQDVTTGFFCTDFLHQTSLNKRID